MNILKKLDEKDKTTSKKGAYYYKFDRKNIIVCYKWISV